MTHDSLLAEIEVLIRRDHACRGLLCADTMHWRQGDLARAARGLAERSGTVAIVTGFAVPFPEGPIAETDGPLGAALLGEVLQQLGRRVVLVTDDVCAAALEVAAVASGLPADCVEAMPVNIASPDEWVNEFLARHPLDDLIAIERVGPSHTTASVVSQHRSVELAPAEFERRVPREHQDHCHNMRGEIIDHLTAPLHRIFDLAAMLPARPATTGIGDGGNEIGMGSLAWEEIAGRLKGPQADWLPCRIATDSTILAGVSNWGGMALAAAAATLAGRNDLARAWTRDRQIGVLEKLVADGPSVDGATRRREATVDGLSVDVYLEPWAAIERLLLERAVGVRAESRL
ncbi:MAG TPA: glutamate cyclase domain-containing protein [Caulifigura sp.]|nr:glutamate cyclase domain-containing protein [Caulifigura sp.]